MNIRRNARLLLTAATLLATTAALAQSSATKQKNSHPSDVSHGHGIGKRQYSPFSTVHQGSPGSTHAAESTSAQTGSVTQHGKMGSAQTNPMYKDKGTSGTNPLFEGKDKNVQPSHHSGATTHEVVEYKDGDDPVMHAHKGSPSTARKSGSIIVNDKNGQQSATRMGGATVAADHDTKAKASKKQPAPHAASPAKQ